MNKKKSGSKSEAPLDLTILFLILWGPGPRFSFCVQLECFEATSIE